jgi:hypothetical protein
MGGGGQKNPRYMLLISFLYKIPKIKNGRF